MKNSIILLIFLLEITPVFGQDQGIGDSEVTQAEFHVAINPTDSNNIILVTMQGFDQEGYNNLAVYYTQDFGESWQQSSFDGEQIDGNGAGDPIVAFDAEGRAYILNLTSDGASFVEPLLSYSDDGGISWENSTLITSKPSDKPWLAIDHFPSSPYQGRIYMPIVEDKLKLYSFAPDFTLIDTIDIPDGNHIPSVVVRKDGTVFTSVIHLAAENTLYVQAYNNGGAALVHSSPVVSYANRIFNAPDISNRFQSTPYLSIDNSSGIYEGRLYLSYTALEAGSENYFDVYLTYSDDDGHTWSAPQVVHGDNMENIQQFYSSTFVNNQGVLVMDWYDRRNHGSDSPLTDFYLGISHDGGETMEEIQLNSISADFEQVIPASNGFGIGEYHQLVATDHTVISFWADGRSNDQNLNIYFAKVNLNNPVAVDELGTVSSTIRISNLYPLPTTDIINIDLQLTANTHLKYFITDNNGNIIRKKNWMHFTNGKHTMTIPTDFPKGIYYLSVVSPNGYIHTKKILKE